MENNNSRQPEKEASQEVLAQLKESVHIWQMHGDLLSIQRASQFFYQTLGPYPVKKLLLEDQHIARGYFCKLLGEMVESKVPKPLTDVNSMLQVSLQKPNLSHINETDAGRYHVACLLLDCAVRENGYSVLDPENLENVAHFIGMTGVAFAEVSPLNATAPILGTMLFGPAWATLYASELTAHAIDYRIILDTMPPFVDLLKTTPNVDAPSLPDDLVF